MTMNATAAPTPAAIAQTPPTPAAAPAGRPSIADRAAALREKLDADPTAASEPTAAETPATPVAKDPPVETTQAAPPADDPAAKARADRLARIEQVRAKENAAEEERAAKRQSKERDTEVEKLRARISELEPLNDVFKDEESVLEHAEKKGWTAEKLVAWMRKKLSDPNAIAERQAQTVEEKLRAELKAVQDRLDAQDKERQAEKQRTEEERAQAAKTTTFISEARAKAESHPRTSKLQGKFGDGGLVAFANQFIAPLLPEGYSTEQLHDHVEQLLDELEAFGGSAPTHAPPANGTSQPPKKNGEAEPATTLSNALTSGRESLVEDVPLHKLSREERKRRLQEKLDRER